ncbi:hypothetical protein HOLleu_04718 [Holothuria leucospilota]|uniref:SET domain-containing protein n=1 Tax=Holothuria leucospilota TaxID=206669 RepID=A0A9Q1CIM8_HOLLE|nr:hypothetical protein HOLleu_04718 [Holothuria leucospilota]
MRTVKVGGPSPRLCLFARRDIGEGEELRYDYGVDDLPWRQVRSLVKSVKIMLPKLRHIASFDLDV